MRDGISDKSPAIMLAPATYSTDQNGVGADLQGFDAIDIMLALGVNGQTFDATVKIEFYLEDADVSTYAAVDQAYILGVTGVVAGLVATFAASHSVPDITEIGYIGPKRYVRLRADFSGSHSTGTPIAIIGVRGHAAREPA
jgi:hypothetical protein